MAEDTAEFVGVLLGMCIFFAGVGGFIVFNEKLRHIEYQGTVPADDVPEYTDATTFGNLSETQKQGFVQVTNATSRTISAPADPLPEYVTRSGDIHHFTRYSTFEWTALGTFGPVLVGLAGAGIVVRAIRRSIRK